MANRAINLSLTLPPAGPIHIAEAMAWCDLAKVILDDVRR
jgi:hypothetical protein